MPEGDTIHRIARRLNVALAGKELGWVEAPNPRSPLRDRASELEGATLERAEAKGKHLLVHLSGDRVVHSHLGMSGRWFVSADGRLPYGKPWLVLASGRAVAFAREGKILRLVSAARARNDPALLQLGPDPLSEGFDEAAAAARILAWEPTEPVGAALLQQGLIAGIGNVIRIEALWLARVSPWRRIDELTPEEAVDLVTHTRWIMETAVRKGRRPKRIYGPPALRPCARCGGKIARRGQGDDNRTTYWCTGCQL